MFLSGSLILCVQIALCSLSLNSQHDNINQFHMYANSQHDNIEQSHVHARLPSILARPGFYPAGVIYLVQCVFWYITGDSAKQKSLEACCLRLRMAAEQKALELAKQETANRVETVIMPGHVVWARSKGHPAWPALVSTAEEASSHGLKGRMLFLFFTYLGYIIPIFLIQNPKDTA